ncbi:hypothetical protein GCM10028862_16540 [Luteimonas pelagia]
MTGNQSNARYAAASAALERGDLQRAMAILRELLHAEPGHVAAWNLAGVVHEKGGDPDAAITCYRYAVERGAGAGVLANLAGAQQKAGRPAAAEAALDEALRREPGLAIAWQKRAGLREGQGRLPEALDDYRRAHALDPRDTKSLGNAYVLRRYLADWDPGAVPSTDTLLAAFADRDRVDFAPFILLSLPGVPSARIRDAGVRFARSQWGATLSADPLVSRAHPLRAGRMRIGYVSSDFRHHAVSFLVLDVIAAHDRDAVEVVLYGHGPPVRDAWRDAAVAAADRFVDIGALSDRAAAEAIAADGIDVLVDLNGYTQHGRPGILAWRPAPVIASWIGYVGSLGEPRLADYVIADPVVAPPGTDADFSESIARMPRCFQPNAGLEALDPPPARADAGLPPDAVVFCSFNEVYKLHPDLWDDWCAILREVPGGVLWLATPRHEAAIANLRTETARRGVDPARLRFAPRLDRRAHLARLQLADIALDTWPYNAGTNASDALRAGVPLLTFPGEAFVGRMAASLLSATGLRECIAADRDALVGMAVALGNDAGARRALRERVRAHVEDAAVFRPEVTARDLESLLREMRQAAIEGRTGPLGARVAGQ